MSNTEFTFAAGPSLGGAGRKCCDNGQSEFSRWRVGGNGLVCNRDPSTWPECAWQDAHCEGVQWGTCVHTFR